MIYPLDFRVPSVGTTPDGSYSNRATPAKTRAIAPPPFKPRRARHVVAPKSRIPAHSCAPLLQGWHRSTRTKPTAAHRAPRVEHLQNMRRTCAIQRSLEDSKLKKRLPPHTIIQPPSNRHPTTPTNPTFPTSPLNLLPIHHLRVVGRLRHSRDRRGHRHPRGQQATSHQRHLCGRRPNDVEARRRHLGEGDVTGVHEATFEDGAEVFMEVLEISDS